MFMLREERIQYQDDFLSQEVQQVLEEFWDIMPHELVAKYPLGGQSTTRSSWSLEPKPLNLLRLGLGLADGPPN